MDYLRSFFKFKYPFVKDLAPIWEYQVTQNVIFIVSFYLIGSPMTSVLKIRVIVIPTSRPVVKREDLNTFYS